jgi:hypothetical protein
MKEVHMPELFGNVIWPSDVIYNIVADSGSKCEGGAEVEHHFVADGKKNVWLQRREGKVTECLVEYYEHAAKRVSNSD